MAGFTGKKVTNNGSRISNFYFPETRKQAKSNKDKRKAAYYKLHTFIAIFPLVHVFILSIIFRRSRNSKSRVSAIKNSIVNVKYFLLSIELIVLLDNSSAFIYTAHLTRN